MDEVLAEAGIKTVLTGIRMPRMNSIMERWVQSCRHERSADETGSSASSMSTHKRLDLHGWNCRQAHCCPESDAQLAHGLDVASVSNITKGLFVFQRPPFLF
ncbi:hypothetical protein ACIBK9_51345 [Nonomuraea sp. NPDC050227]|uniref:hypothetical protein n=1 Tax=Nonomuraea sp. NPDC050227 TaxID=3364360 RepID=UPI0037A26B50